MFYKYMSGWGTDKTGYKFEGYIKDELVKTVYKENNETFEFLLDVKSKELHIEDTYDVARCVISKVNQKNEVIPYSFDPINIKVTGSIELIGPSEVSLQSGVIAFWVKTKSKGKGKITITTGNKILSEEVVVS